MRPVISTSDKVVFVVWITHFVRSYLCPFIFANSRCNFTSLNFALFTLASAGSYISHFYLFSEMQPLENQWTEPIKNKKEDNY